MWRPPSRPAGLAAMPIWDRAFRLRPTVRTSLELPAFFALIPADWSAILLYCRWAATGPAARNAPRRKGAALGWGAYQLMMWRLGAAEQSGCRLRALASLLAV